jgi:hypothetical protein
MRGAMKPGDPKPLLRVCASCPFLIENHGKPHPAKWYSTGNLRRLWNGLRSGRAPGMVCHATDPDSKGYGGTAEIRPGRESQCAGAWLLILQNANAFSAGKPQPFQPPLARSVLAEIAWKLITGTLPDVEDRGSEVGLPPMRRRMADAPRA